MNNLQNWSPRALTLLLGLMTTAALEAAELSPFFSVQLHPSTPAFTRFSIDSLGGGRLSLNPVLPVAGSNGGLTLVASEKTQAYVSSEAGTAVWAVSGKGSKLAIRSKWHGQPVPPMVLKVNQKLNHATLLGLMQPGERSVPMPCVLHLPDMGSVRITCKVPGLALNYEARRYVPQPFVEIQFPGADKTNRVIEYDLEVTALYPKVPGIESDPAYDGYRRNYLNVFQVNPRLQMLANNASSDIVPFTVFIYSAVAREAPPLAKGLTCLDLVRMTLDRYLAGVKGYGQSGYGTPKPDADVVPWVTPFTSADTYPSLLIAAGDYIDGARDQAWARRNYPGLARWAREILATDKDGNGLIEYPGTGNYGDRPVTERRPANWWDTINFGHEDAYSNALAYEALRRLSAIARRLKETRDAEIFAQAADRLRKAYTPALLNPDTGVLGGWRSADGKLHDYWFTFVNGVAITYDLLDEAQANHAMDRLIAKMREVGYTNFSLGLPGNLVPVRKGDYVSHGGPPERHGEPRLEDGSDGFQYYENGGATGCFAYFTLKALYKLGRFEDARMIFRPMLEGYTRGEFQGFCENGMSRDWRDWSGGGHGYEGLLVDNYMPLLAVVDEWRLTHDRKKPARRP